MTWHSAGWRDGGPRARAGDERSRAPANREAPRTNQGGKQVTGTGESVFALAALLAAHASGPPAAQSAAERAVEAAKQYARTEITIV
jgi:hypothetical protein